MTNGQNRQGAGRGNENNNGNNGGFMDKMRQGFENVVDAITGDDDNKGGGQKNRNNQKR
ncbi:hypothetical protein [Bacillus sp. FJAT-27225]|uniref:hypothetical protein n=1 Tax=Bacillus sp. FJAT-27225 TaxID=1743144 RepID=UPI001586C66F|nr:hypothetical protein [Bacillus sp. FJAT-27225]